MQKHDQVISRATHPATGYIVRVGHDWVDVEWHVGIGCVYRKRSRKRDVIQIADVLVQRVSQSGCSKSDT